LRNEPPPRQLAEVAQFDAAAARHLERHDLFITCAS